MNQSDDPGSGVRVRVFLDANVLYSAAIGGKLSCLWSRDDITLVTTVYAAQEAMVNLKAPEHAASLHALLSRIEVHDHHAQDASQTSYPLRDPKDVPILQAAIDLRCRYLLTADRSCFGSLYCQRIDGVEISAPGYFINRLLGKPLP